MREDVTVRLVHYPETMLSHKHGLYSLSGKTSYRQISLSLMEFARKLSEPLEKIKPESRSFETSRDLVVRRPSA